MNAVGIDVSKGNNMVAIIQPFDEIISAPFEIKHTPSNINSLVKLINSVDGESRIVMEHTGHYYEVLTHHLAGAGLFGSASIQNSLKTLIIIPFEKLSLMKLILLKSPVMHLTNSKTLNSIVLWTKFEISLKP